MRATIRARLVLGALALTLLSGCGDDQIEINNAYVGRADRVVQAFQTEFQQLQESFTSQSTTEEDLATLGALRAATERTVLALRAITPPEPVKALHLRLTAEVREYATAVGEAEPGFGSDDPRRVVAARSRFSEALAAVAAKVTATINTINDRLT